MQHILLTEAGFSRNWGGWLADEAFEYLLDSKHIDDEIRSLLWKYKNHGGFEAALAEMPNGLAKHPTTSVVEKVPQFEKLAKVEVAVWRMFDDMNRAFARRPFEFTEDPQYSIGRFLTRFNAIFTLNQDLLMEHHYINGNYLSDSNSRWTRCESPGIERLHDNSTQFIYMQWSPLDDPKRFAVDKGVQPYFKLHDRAIGWTSAGDSQCLF